MKHPVRITDGAAAKYGIDLESTGLRFVDERLELLRDPSRGHYWLSQYREQGHGSWHELTSMDQQTGELVLRHPEMIAHYLRTGEWVVPSS